MVTLVAVTDVAQQVTVGEAEAEPHHQRDHRENPIDSDQHAHHPDDEHDARQEIGEHRRRHQVDTVGLAHHHLMERALIRGDVELARRSVQPVEHLATNVARDPLGNTERDASGDEGHYGGRNSERDHRCREGENLAAPTVRDRVVDDPLDQQGHRQQEDRLQRGERNAEKQSLPRPPIEPTVLAEIVGHQRSPLRIVSSTSETRAPSTSTWGGVNIEPSLEWLPGTSTIVRSSTTRLQR